MSESKKAPELWKAETVREERKARLSAMKAKDGGKKPIRLNNRVVRLVVVLVLVVALLGTGTWYVLRMGIPARFVTAATVGSENIKGTELNFYFYSICNQYSISPSTDEGKEMLAGESGIDGFKTLSDYIKDSAAKEVQNTVMLATKAKEAGLSLNEEDQARIMDYFSQAEDQATTEKTSLDNLLSDTFGAGMNKAELQTILERILLANRFSEKLVDEMKFTDAELAAFHEANKNDYDVVEYREFLVEAVYASDATDEVKNLAMAAAKAKADKMLTDVNDDATFKAAALANAADADKATYQTGDVTLKKNVTMSSVSTTEAGTWAFDAARKPGDKIISETSSGYYVYLFKSRSRADFNHVSVRHILIDSDRAKDAADVVAAAKANAEKILAEYLAGEKTAAAFAKLAEANSTDTGSSTNGGLYEDVAPGAMVEEFDAWCFDPARKPGDTGIVQTDYGFHIMYFEKVDGVDWIINVTDQMKNDAYDKFLKDEAAKFPYELKSLGMNFVG